MPERFDVVIIGSGVGGSAIAHSLAPTGKSILVLERGERLVREDRNWDAEEVYAKACYKADEDWFDAQGKAFQPGQFYFVGGNTKVFGTTMFRFRAEDFGLLEHEGGTSPAWPISYDTLEPWYAEAERLFGVHGEAGHDPTEPPRSGGFPFGPVPHDPEIAFVFDRLREQGLKPFPLPTSVQYHDGGKCVACDTCDGFPCKVDGKGDAEVCLLDPALAPGNVSLRTGARVERLITDDTGKKIVAAEVAHDGGSERIEADLFVLSAGAINSAALLLRSANETNPDGLANSSGMVGRFYMNHNCSAVMALKPCHKFKTQFQKSLSLNDFYFGDGENYRYPLGNIQLLGKIKEPMLRGTLGWMPKWGREWLAGHSVDWYAMSEDLPDPESRVTVRVDGGICLSWRRTNTVAHARLVARTKRFLRKAGFPIVVSQTFSKETPSHQCGTVRFGDDPAQAPLDPFCKAYDHENLYVVDAGFFPSSAAVNPALTVAAQALRVGARIREMELQAS
ncbi:MAG: GMC family oxidoreductase [Rhodospirillaceae bacterium]|jgi:choline dehydrogenase-like flavoprotein|nr:GMC family oxidoreductase [Rhodospirillales bacterium]MBT6406911.1 GMC family oxidoreductase [Rhodospirillaceae bacterium]